MLSQGPVVVNSYVHDIQDKVCWYDSINFDLAPILNLEFMANILSQHSVLLVWPKQQLQKKVWLFISFKFTLVKQEMHIKVDTEAEKEQAVTRE